MTTNSGAVLGTLGTPRPEFKATGHQWVFVDPVVGGSKGSWVCQKCGKVRPAGGKEFSKCGTIVN